MMRDWREVEVDDIKANRPASMAMGPFGSNITANNFVPFGVPVIRGGNLRNGFIDEDFVYLTEEKANELKSSNAFPNDIVFTHRGTIGQVGLIPADARFPRYVVSQSQMKLSCNLDLAEPLFVYYFFISPLGQSRLLANTSQTGVPAIAQPLSSLRRIKIPLPPLAEQRAIAQILGSLDDKIELNRRMNATLEATARALFQSWFVDFDPVHAKARGEQPAGMDAATAALFPDSFEESALGLIPAGWRVISLVDCATFINGAAYKNIDFSSDNTGLPVVKIAEIKNGVTGQTKFTEKDLDRKYYIDDGELLFSWSGNPETSIDTFIWTGGPAWLNQHIFRVIPNTGLPASMVYLLLRYLKPEFTAIATDKQTTGLGHVTRRDMERLKFSVPSHDVISAFDFLTKPLLDQVYNYMIESRTLAETRDALLPKLVSGEVRVGDF